MPRESMHGKTALITGAAQRLGRATALALAEEGANIIVHYRSSAGGGSRHWPEIIQPAGAGLDGAGGFRRSRKRDLAAASRLAGSGDRWIY